MKTQHHNTRGYYNDANGTTVHATITMSLMEWRDFADKVARAHATATRKHNTYVRDNANIHPFSTSRVQISPPARVRVISTTCARILLGDTARHGVNYGVIIK
jgi:hypothetical protein